MDLASPARLRVNDLYVHRRGGPRLVGPVSFELREGERLAIVGPSGAGKTSILRALVALGGPQLVCSGNVSYAGAPPVDLADARRAPGELAALRGSKVAWIPQDGAASLEPVITVAQAFALVAGSCERAIDAEAELASVALPAKVLDQRTDTLSGGMAARVALALALAPLPRVVLADEPSGALDGPSALAIRDHLVERTHGGVSLVLVSHDLGWLAPVATHLLVLDEHGRVAEAGPAEALLGAPASETLRAQMEASRT